MKNKIFISPILLMLLACTFSQAQVNSIVADRIRAAEYLRVGANTSQKVTGFSTTMPAVPTNFTLPTAKAVQDYVLASFQPIGQAAGGDLGGNYPNPTVEGIQGFPVSDVAPTSGQVLRWDGSAYVPDDDTQTLSIDGNELTLSDGGGTVTLPDGALGTGFVNGGGSGDVPYDTDVRSDNGGAITTHLSFFSQFTPFGGLRYFGLGASDGATTATYGFSDDGGLVFGSEVSDGVNTYYNLLTTIGEISNSNGTVVKTSPQGVEMYSDVGNNHAYSYRDDVSAYVMSDDRRVPDVGTVNLLKQTPVSYSNAAAPNNSIFYSTTDSKLSYKDPAGVVHNLY